MIFVKDVQVGSILRDSLLTVNDPPSMVMIISRIEYFSPGYTVCVQLLLHIHQLFPGDDLVLGGMDLSHPDIGLLAAHCESL